MTNSNIKNSISNLLLFFISILATIFIINFLLIIISSQSIFPRPLAASLPNTLLTFYPETYNKKNLNNYTAVLGNSAAQGNGDAYLEGKENYSFSHHLYDLNNKNYLIFGRAGFHSIASVTNLIKIQILSNNNFMIKNLNKPDSLIFVFYEGIDLMWNYNLYKEKALENENILNYTTRLINKSSKPSFFEKFNNIFPVIPFIGSFIEDFWKLIKEVVDSKSLKDVAASLTDRVKKLFGANAVVLNDRKVNELTWQNSLIDHENVKNIRPIQGAADIINTEQILIGLEIFYESVKYAKSWSNTDKVEILYIPAPITVYDWKEPIIYEHQSKFPNSKEDVKGITNKQNNLKSSFIRREIKNFTKKNNFIFLDPTEILIDKGKTKVLHGPLDWGHLNNDGYKIVSDFIMEQGNNQ